MAKYRSTGATGSKRNLEDGIWQWRILEHGEAFGTTKYTEERMSKTGNEMIQLVVKVGDKNGHIIILENLVFSEKAEWKVNEFLKSAGIYPGEVEYELTASMCLGLSGNCKTKNKQDGDYTNTNISEWLEATNQDVTFLSSKAVANVDEPVDEDTIPF